VSALQEAGITTRTVATGQHYDAELTDSFFDALGLQPDARWELPDGEAERVGAILSGAFRELSADQPDLVLVLGDTYTVPLFCLAARRFRVPIAHLEAGLRSFNETSMEEVNRKFAGASASLHFAPTDLAGRFLLDEGVAPERIRVVGNPVIDVLRKRGAIARPLEERSGVVVTAHRQTNVDDPVRLDALVRLVLKLSEEIGPVTFPLHPRTRARLEETGLISQLDGTRVRLLPPVPFDEMLNLLGSARVVVTDSGGLQEEASWLGVPVVVLRRSTPRWEGVAAGTSALTGLEVDRALAAARRFCEADEQRRVAATPCPYGDGHTATLVAEILLDPATAPLLRIEECDFVGRPPPS
jgi:UDP-N-acetylglucosamine 2-epimerase (non-hydrolysing)